MLDDERVEDLMSLIADKFTAEELCEILELDVWDIIEAFREQVLERHGRFEI